MGIDTLRAAAALLLCGLVGPAFAAEATASEAIVQYDADGTVRLHTTSADVPSGDVIAQYPGPDGKARCCTVLKATGREAAEASAGVSDPLGLGKVSTYRAEGPALPRRPERFVGAAVFGGAGQRLRQRSPSDLRLDAGGTKETVVACATREGFHVMRTAGAKPLGHLYLSFDYEVKPTCSARQTRLLSGR